MKGAINPILEVLASYIISRQQQPQNEAQKPLSPKLIQQTKQTTNMNQILQVLVDNMFHNLNIQYSHRRSKDDNLCFQIWMLLDGLHHVHHFHNNRNMYNFNLCLQYSRRTSHPHQLVFMKLELHLGCIEVQYLQHRHPAVALCWFKHHKLQLHRVKRLKNI